jgi:peptidyl-prolyl cis-trans isomerase C
MTRPISLLLGVILLLATGCQEKARVLAKVQGKEVTQAELDAYLRFKHLPASDSKRREAAFDELLQREAMANVIEKQVGFEKGDIDAELADVRRELLINRYLDRFLESKVTDAAVKSYYDAHVKDYEQRKVHAAHILVRTNPKMSEAEKAAKLTTAADLKAKLDAGANFEELARGSSDDKVSGSKGGDLGWLREGSIDAEFSKRAFAAPPNVVSEPFATPFGYHLLRVLEPPKVVRRPYQAVLGEIRYQLRAEAKEAELKRLKDLVKIEKKGEYKLDPKAQQVQSAKRTPPPPPALPPASDGEAQLDPGIGLRPQPPATAPAALEIPVASAAAPQAKAPTSKKTTPGARPAAAPKPAAATPAPAPAPAPAAAPAPAPAVPPEQPAAAPAE